MTQLSNIENIIGYFLLGLQHTALESLTIAVKRSWWSCTIAVEWDSRASQVDFAV